jgi:hypothetical protein
VFRGFCGLDDDWAVVLRDFKEDTNPTPLLLVFSDEDCSTPEQADFYRRAFLDQVLAQLVCDLNLLPVEAAYTRTSRELVEKVTGGVLRYLGRDRQRSLCRLVKARIFNRIAAFWKGKPFEPARLEADVLTIFFNDNDQKEEFTERLEDAKRTNFGTDRPGQQQLDLLGLQAQP